ncbi:MAG: anthranilate phosphoribosyltransferase [Gemmatimonadales bacterium]
MPDLPTPRSTALRRALDELRAGRTLSRDDALSAFHVLMDGSAPAAEIEELLLGLRRRGESAEEIAGAALALRQVMVKLESSGNGLVDTCGTGGGTIRTFNISSGAAFVAAGAGVRVAKHGNRSHTTRSGSADVFEALGIDIALPVDRASAVLREAGIVFLYAPQYHPAMRHVAPVRRKLGVSTVMNLIGPLANPAGARRQVMGVFDRDRAPQVAEALAGLRSERALVVHARVGMDEVSPAGVTDIWEVRQGRVETWVLDPADHELAHDDIDALAGGDPVVNARRVRRILEGIRDDPAGRCAVLLNAAAAIHVSGNEEDFGAAVSRARTSLDSGAALRVVERLQRLAPIAPA